MAAAVEYLPETASPNTQEGGASDVDEPRNALVDRWNAAVNQAKMHWKPKFDRMVKDEKFARGYQWPNDNDHEKYVANITLRHVNQRVSDLYAKNPRVVAEEVERLAYEYWDGNTQTLMTAQQILMSANSPEGAGAVDPGLAATARMIVQDAVEGHNRRRMLKRMARTMEILFQRQIENQPTPFKQQMKNLVRRAVSTGIGYVRLDFQRETGLTPEVEAEIKDVRHRLAQIERLSSEKAEGDISEEDADAEQLRLHIQQLEQDGTEIVHEGLIFDFPHSTRVIPDMKCTNVVGFQNCDWVAIEHPLTTAQIREIYGVDVGEKFNARRAKEVLELTVDRMHKDAPGGMSEDRSKWATVYEIFSKRDGLVYTICDGYDDFLIEPHAPNVALDRFWPIYTYALNQIDCEDDPFPPSDVSLIWHMQREVNRARQSIREHRLAARPKIIVPSGVLAENDKKLLQNPSADGIPVLELLGLQPNQKVQDLLQSFNGPGLDPNLYEVATTMDDVQRTVGVQEANLGGTSNATATESSIAETARMATSASAIDDLDELLSELAKDASQIMLTEISPMTARDLVGPGAVWPELSGDTIAKEMHLRVEAGSTGRPNQAQEIQNAERIVPLLMQIPGINPEWLGKEMLRRMDDRINIEDAFSAGMPSIQALNAQLMKQAEGMADAGGDPLAQGGQGGEGAGGGQQGAAPGSQPTNAAAGAQQQGDPRLRSSQAEGPQGQMRPAPGQAQLGPKGPLG